MSLPAETPESQRLLANIGRRMLKRRVDLLLALPVASLGQTALRQELQAIGREADKQ